MEPDQRVLCVPRTEHFWQRVSDCSSLEQIVSLASQCILWVIPFYAYRRFELVLQGRQRVARQRGQLHGYRSQSHSERDAVEQLCLEVQTLPRSLAGSVVIPTLVPEGGGLVQEFDEHLQVPVSICVDPCGADLVAVGSLKHEASRLRGLGQEVEFLQACARPVVQRRVRVLAGDTARKLLEIIGKENHFLVQLGRWEQLEKSSGVEETRMLKLDDTSGAVPVVFH